MRSVRSFGLVAVALGVAVACATGAELEEGEGVYDASIGVPGDDSSVGSGGDPTGGGGASNGGMYSNGGATAGGKTASGGAGKGGRASGGEDGEGGAGGAAEDGGASSDGGKASSSGGAASGGAGGKANGGSGSCPTGQKDCNSAGCLAPNPAIGCGLTGCTSCPQPPANAYASCDGENCVWACYVGYTKNTAGDACEQTGGGTGGASGSPCANGDESGCPDCTVVQGRKCCTSQNKCGCPIFYIPGTCG